MSWFSFPIRVETDTFIPTKKQFTPIFNRVGGGVWSKWDQYLQNQEDEGMGNQLVETCIYLIHANRSGGWS
jgi:hypothetical protein